MTPHERALRIAIFYTTAENTIVRRDLAETIETAIQDATAEDHERRVRQMEAIFNESSTGNISWPMKS